MQDKFEKLFEEGALNLGSKYRASNVNPWKNEYLRGIYKNFDEKVIVKKQSQQVLESYDDLFKQQIDKLNFFK